MKTPSYEEVLDRLHELQDELEDQIELVLTEKRRQFHYHLERGKVRFEREMRDLHRRYRTGLWTYLTHARLAHVLTAPVIYAVVIPIAFFDLAVTLYQHICFRAWGIPLVRRANHIIIDRHQLDYLNAIEKLNCVYCGYGNGVIAYAREITARTEQYWCPIKHARRIRGEHDRVEHFIDYGDAETYRKRLQELRRDWSDITGER